MVYLDKKYIYIMNIIYIRTHTYIYIYIYIYKIRVDRTVQFCPGQGFDGDEGMVGRKLGKWRGPQVTQMVKDLPAIQETWV